jgi:hypothetical protein
VFDKNKVFKKTRKVYEHDEDLICGLDNNDTDPMKEGSQYRTTHSNYISKNFRDLMHAALE